MLELLGDQNANFEIGERVYIGRDGRNKVISVLGRLDYVNISQSAKSELPTIVEKVVTTNEKRFVDYINMAQALTPRIHALELIPGIGKIYMMTIIKKREVKKFVSFADIQDRVGLRDPAKLIVKRIIDENNWHLKDQPICKEMIRSRRRTYGQHMLIEAPVIERIVNSVCFVGTESVCELVRIRNVNKRTLQKG